MPIYIYNSLSRKKEELIPLEPSKVNIYTCGVTVYDESHIGHARSLYIFDVIRRYLKYRGFEVKFVRNITDIDDKIINRAKELKVNWQELVQRYIDRYYEDIQSLGIEKGSAEPRATENIPEMIKHIEKLMEKGYAYLTDSGVYFRVRNFKDYGKLSGQSIEQMFSGVRKEPDETKQDPLDFALWKKSKPDEPAWESPWGLGRPGWHIECSVMSTKYLKTETLDIHAGGQDLIFPHHENEIAQSEALTGVPFAKYWLHHGLLTINGQKMAKSLGNFVTVKDFIKKYKYADILKLFFLSAHYSQPMDYTDSRLQEAREALERIKILIDKPVSSSKGPRVLNKDIEECRNKFIAAMDDDFNTPEGLAAIFDLIKITNKNISEPVFVNAARAVIRELLDIFGISLGTEMLLSEEIGLKEYINARIKERERARKENKYDAADKIRKELEEKDIILEDTKDGTTWRRKL
jgi:cysteinyl-tRNA synthetase